MGSRESLGGTLLPAPQGDQGRAASRRGKGCTEAHVGGTGMGRLCGVPAGGLPLCWHGDGVEGGTGLARGEGTEPAVTSASDIGNLVYRVGDPSSPGALR